MNSGVFALLVAFSTISVIYADDHDYYGRYCQRPAYPRYGGIKGQVYDRYDLGSSVYFYCDYGYELVGYASARCSHGPRGTYYWNYEPPVCRPKVIYCGKLPDPNGGSVDLTGTRVGSRATYRCDKGYFLVGSSTRKCQKNGRWSGSAPVCKLVDCGYLPDPNNGDVKISATTFRGVAIYTCDKGYVLFHGNSKRVCQANGEWSGTAPICKVVDCGDLPDPSNGDVRISKTTFGGVANYSCDTGYFLVGNGKRECQANGKWSGAAPICKIVDCGSLPDPKNGDVKIPRTTFRGKAVYSCNDGYNLFHGDRVRVCQANGHWSGTAPTCKIVDCGSLPDPRNGDVDISRTTFGGKAVYSCDEGHTLTHGNKVRVCQANGQWSGTAPLCRVVDCGDLPDPTNGDVRISTTVFGGVAIHSCDTGYFLVGNVKRVCQANGKWSGAAPICKIVDCGDLPDPKNGDVKISRTTFRGKAVYSCNKGYNLFHGDRVRVCQANGKWSGTAPTCKVVDCGSLPDPTNGDVSISKTTFRGKAVYSCDEGHTLTHGDRVRVCQDDGLWSGTAPLCIVVDCGDLPDPRNGDVSISTTVFGGVALHSCDTGYFLVGNEKRVCQANGTWSGTAPICKIVDCGKLPDPKNGDVKISETTFGGKAVYSCDRGFDLIHGDRVRMCQANGQWSGTAPTCKIVDCGKLPDPKNGNVWISRTTFGGTATYTCDKRFFLIGDEKRVCQANGEWSGSAPTCKYISCGSVYPPRHGYARTSCSYYGCTTSYWCQRGYTLKGYKTRTCQANGYWSYDDPTCH